MKGNLAIIPARGGSRRIPRKNIKHFLDKPVIAYSIQAALDSGLFEEVMVSTDDAEIAAIAKQYGATVPFTRSAKNADDHATTSAVLEEVLLAYSGLNREFQAACCLYPCAPFITSTLLRNAYDKLHSEGLDCVLPVVAYGNSIWRSLAVNDDGQLRMNWPENAPKRTQDLPAAYHDAGQFYFFNVPHFLNTKDLWKGNNGAVILPETAVQDIDTEQDWVLAELKYKLLNRL